MAQGIFTPFSRVTSICEAYPVNNILCKLITHGYQFRPQVWVIDDKGEEIEPGVVHVNSMQVNVLFGSLFTGTIYIGV